MNQLKKARNAVAHKSDKAWNDFIELVQKNPFALKKSSLKGITVGRLLSSHDVSGKRVLLYGTDLLRTAAKAAVP